MNWKHGLIFAMSAFILLMMYFLWGFLRVGRQTVTNNAYEKGLVYESALTERRQAARFPIKVSVGSGQLTVGLPEKNGDGVKGELHFYRPSDENLDFVLDFKPDSLGLQQISTDKMKAGRWRLLANWTKGQTNYYDEAELYIP